MELKTKWVHSQLLDAWSAKLAFAVNILSINGMLLRPEVKW